MGGHRKNEKIMIKKRKESLTRVPKITKFFLKFDKKTSNVLLTKNVLSRETCFI